MKVQDSPLTVVPAATARVAQGSGQTEQVEQKQVKDKVSVSSPREEAALDAARSSVASSRSARVQEIISAVRSGQYYPSPQQIAQRLVSEAEVEARIRALMAK
jgi:anti-sigma28 factor (negative regulator of flagellin synthesis)